MQRETVEEIFKERGLSCEDDVFTVPEDEIATILVGRGTVNALPGIIRFVMRSSFLVVTTRKGTQTYVEYEVIRALSFEPKEVADRRTGFV